MHYLRGHEETALALDPTLQHEAVEELKQLKEEHPEEVILEIAADRVYCKLPTMWLHISPDNTYKELYGKGAARYEELF